jgi:hypothetical protein
LETEIREAMVYQAPPEMGALYSKVFEMRDVIKLEQDKARKKRDDEVMATQGGRASSTRERQTYLVSDFPIPPIYVGCSSALFSRIGNN